MRRTLIPIAKSLCNNFFVCNLLFAVVLSRCDRKQKTSGESAGYYRILKKRTGQNVSTHIKGRLLDECKAFLIQTTWSLEQISYAVGFSDQPNFNFFFKKNTGCTPNAFRKGVLL
ncbi:helix-turn-helix domain-containing protein [Olivibacter sp. CPCC 100613]|uniref:helix-turn-helix domain-containing protein n=1 Tax=Olivibacter sp. CPCC 100613 TaxID=3079931 RepID=UPI002FFCA059